MLKLHLSLRPIWNPQRKLTPLLILPTRPGKENGWGSHDVCELLAFSGLEAQRWICSCLVHIGQRACCAQGRDKLPRVPPAVHNICLMSCTQHASEKQHFLLEYKTQIGGESAQLLTGQPFTVHPSCGLSCFDLRAVSAVLYCVKLIVVPVRVSSICSQISTNTRKQTERKRHVRLMLLVFGLRNLLVPAGAGKWLSTDHKIGQKQHISLHAPTI